jgi:3-dehydroquinate synthase
MAKVTVQLPAAPASDYPIIIQAGLLRQPQTWLSRCGDFENVVIITDHHIRKLYGHDLAQSLKKSGRRVLLLAFRPGEASKNQQIKQNLEEKMLRHGCGLNTVCLALGGGVCGDIAGFIAATYMRGIPLIQIPTSLLAMVDSSVGGKTAIDTPYGKNLIGAFWQPRAVIADIRCLQSLPKKHLINGLIEAIKMALTSDKKGFHWLQKHWRQCLAGHEKTLQKVIQQAVKIKAAVVAEDEREQKGPRMILNFGHTIGHAIEKISGYKILHGYAVAYGILIEARVAELSGILAAADYALIASFFADLDIHAHDLKKYSVEKIIQATRHDKKNLSGKTRYILLKTIGEIYRDGGAYAHPVTDAVVKQAFQSCGDIYAGK